MESQFGIANLWAQGDWVTRGVAVLLLLMSLASWIVIVLKAWDVLRLRRHTRAAQDFWRSEDFTTGLARLGDDAGNPFRELAQAAQEASAHHAQASLQDQLDRSEWITRSLRNHLDDCSARLQAGLAILASVGSTAPFVGLFGTVWGIYHALLAIGSTGQSTIDKVAGPVGEALIMTALGLAVAIPAVLGYNALVRGNKAVLHQLRRFAHDLHTHFVAGSRVGAAAAAAAAAAAEAEAEAAGKVLTLKKGA